MSEAEYRKRREAFNNDPETARLGQEVKAAADSEGISDVYHVLNRQPFLERYIALHQKHDYWPENEVDPETWHVDTPAELCRRLRKLIDTADRTRHLLAQHSGEQLEVKEHAERVRGALRIAKEIVPESRRLEVDKLLLDVGAKLTLDDQTRWYIRIVELLSTVPAPALLSVQWGNGAARREVLPRVLTHLKRRSPFNATIHDLGRRDPAPRTKKDLRLVFAGNPETVRIVDEDGPVSIDGTLDAQVGRAATDAEAIAARQWIALERGGIVRSTSSQKQAGKLRGRLARYSTCDLASLVKRVDKLTQPKAKGDVLEALTCRLIQTVPGFTLKDHGPTKTRTEEIDIVVNNECRKNPFHRLHTGPLLLFECKNWFKKCGKDEVVCFEDKLRNRRGQCNVGFLVSWNGFTRGATEHLLRKSDTKLVIGFIDGKMIKSAVAENTFFETLVKAWEKTVLS